MALAALSERDANVRCAILLHTHQHSLPRQTQRQPNSLLTRITYIYKQLAASFKSSHCKSPDWRLCHNVIDNIECNVCVWWQRESIAQQYGKQVSTHGGRACHSNAEAKDEMGIKSPLVFQKFNDAISIDFLSSLALAKIWYHHIFARSFHNCSITCYLRVFVAPVHR